MGGLIKFVIVLSQLLCVIDFVVSKNVFQMSIQPEKSTDNDRETGNLESSFLIFTLLSYNMFRSKSKN